MALVGVFIGYLAIKNIAFINSHSIILNENLFKITVNLPSKQQLQQMH
jgi:hypothetical protein